MELPDNYILIRKEVKHARLRVSEDGKVRIIAPPTFSEDDISAMLKKKAKWIDSNLKYFNGMAKVELQRNQLLLFGNRYSYFYDTTYAQKVTVDHEHKTITSQRDLLETVSGNHPFRHAPRSHRVPSRPMPSPQCVPERAYSARLRAGVRRAPGVLNPRSSAGSTCRPQWPCRWG
jgi:hypothetical protein